MFSSSINLNPKHFSESKSCFEKALELDSNNKDALYNPSLVDAKLKEYAKSLDHLNKII
jgi:tetratricopeptide (TPR) repeat protein